MVLKVYRGISQQAMDTGRIKQTVAEDRHLTFWSALTKAAVSIVCVVIFS